MDAFLGALLLAAQGSTWVDPAPTGRWAGSTTKLASELLPPEMAADAVSHQVTHPILGLRPFSVIFSGRLRSTNDGFCERYRYYVHIGSQADEPVAGDPPVRSTQLRLGKCPTAPNAIFANLNSSVPFGAKQAMRWVEWAQRIARSNASLPFSITCHTETGPDRCADGGRRALASLPLDKLFIVMAQRHAPPHHWQLAVTESEPGQLLWDVALDATPGASSIALTWKIPAPF